MRFLNQYISGKGRVGRAGVDFYEKAMKNALHARGNAVAAPNVGLAAASDSPKARATRDSQGA